MALSWRTVRDDRSVVGSVTVASVVMEAAVTGLIFGQLACSAWSVCYLGAALCPRSLFGCLAGSGAGLWSSLYLLRVKSY